MFKDDVHQGLSSQPKSLPSKYFYDKKGDELFVKIMNLPEYYLTRCELDIFKNKTLDLIDAMGVKKDNYFELIELGAGDGTKTKELLRVLAQLDYKFDYFPIDISTNALEGLKNRLNKELPQVNIKTQQGDYFEILNHLKERNNNKVILFLGSNIGNMSDPVASLFISKLAHTLQKGDKLLLGIDLIKPKEIVLPAYNDSQGVTAHFNINLLHRINQELGANFNLQRFQHQPEYCETTGIAKSYIVSTHDQKVDITATGQSYPFHQGEKIHTEISRKYNDAILKQLIGNTPFSLRDKILDHKGYFADYILEKQ